jgi:SAM-dependent methyltransferase
MTITAGPEDAARQQRSEEWHDQWSRFADQAEGLFHEWIAPVEAASFRGLSVLEGGCGGGHHTAILARVAREVTAVDLNTADLASARVGALPHVTIREDDLGTMALGRQFDAVVCIGVIHHTDDPDRTFENLFRHTRPGGRLVIWAYSAEGNGLVRFAVEPARKLFLRFLPRPLLAGLSRLLTALLWLPAHTVYRLPFLRFLPYFEYLASFRRLSFERNTLNVFDKLNAPQTRFLTRRRVEGWMSPARFEPASIVVRHHAGVSWSLSGVRRQESAAEGTA